MSDVWEVDVWGPAVRRRVAAKKAEVGRDALTDEEFDACVLSSLDVLPVPVVQIPWDPKNGGLPDLGRVGEALVRLEAASLVRTVTCVDRHMVMRSSLRGQPLDRGATVAPA